MFCSNCGSNLQGQFCSNCGASVTKPSEGGGLVFQETRTVAVTKPGAPNSGLAIAALICVFFVPLIGLILGLLARTDIRNSNGNKGGDGLANAAILLGIIFSFLFVLVAVAWLSLLVAI
ncbi:MAG: hypothetical protein RIS55_916 [Actinomycetota bacterium]